MGVLIAPSQRLWGMHIGLDAGLLERGGFCDRPSGEL